jgi:hypothetical protein
MMLIRLIEPARAYTVPLNVCSDTCQVHISVPLGDKYLVLLLRRLAEMNGQKAVIGFDGLNFELTELPGEGRLLLSAKGDSRNVKLCKVVF